MTMKQSAAGQRDYERECREREKRLYFARRERERFERSFRRSEIAFRFIAFVVVALLVGAFVSACLRNGIVHASLGVLALGIPVLLVWGYFALHSRIERRSKAAARIFNFLGIGCMALVLLGSLVYGAIQGYREFGLWFPLVTMGPMAGLLILLLYSFRDAYVRKWLKRRSKRQ